MQSSSPLPDTPEPEELVLEVSGLRLAARAWGPESGQRVLALHGWLDNAASFDRLAPLLPGLRLVALDLPGHGASDHLPAAASYHFIDWVAHVSGAAQALDWDRFVLLGHSMGGGICSLLTGTFPQRVERLVLLEGIGPLTSAPEDGPRQLARAIPAAQRRASQKPRICADLDHAVAIRTHSGLSEEAARHLVTRGTEAVTEGLRFRHDPRLGAPSRLRLTEDHVHAFLAAIRCPVLVVRARDGWPIPAPQLAARIAAIPNVRALEVAGDHHVHLTRPATVAPLILQFLAD